MTTKCDRNTPFSFTPVEGLEDYEIAGISDRREETAVGDLNSDAQGSGARKNEGKPRLDLIPVSVWRKRWFFGFFDKDDIYKMMCSLERWQEGDDKALSDWLVGECCETWIDEAVKVLTFGAEKYKAWNWAKGMDWSVCVGCILRHTEAIVWDKLEIDDDSGFKHVGHIVANIIFLDRYMTQYPQGDDRPPRFV